MIVKKKSRQHAIEFLVSLLNAEDAEARTLSIQGPPNNVEFLTQVLLSATFEEGRATTEWIDRGGLLFTPRYDENLNTLHVPLILLHPLAL